MKHWIKNIHKIDFHYHKPAGDVVKGSPQPNRTFSQQELIRLGIVGIYRVTREEKA